MNENEFRVRVLENVKDHEERIRDLEMGNAKRDLETGERFSSMKVEMVKEFSKVAEKFVEMQQSNSNRNAIIQIVVTLGAIFVAWYFHK